MSFRRILLKKASGAPVASLTISSLRPRVTMPEGITAILTLTDKISTPTDQSAIYFPAGGDISLLARKEGELLFGSTLPAEQAAYAKWRLLTALDERGKAPMEAPTESLGKSEMGEIVEPMPETAIEMQESIEEKPIESEAVTLEESAAEESITTPSKLERAEALLSRGTPFTLFDSVMPGSRWATIKEDDAEYLIGIIGEGERILFGIPGAVDYPPDEGRLWSFFPTDESGEIGYYLTEAEDSI